MCSLPVTLGGGMTMQNGVLPPVTSGLKAPAASQASYQRPSKVVGSYRFGISLMTVSCSHGMAGPGDRDGEVYPAPAGLSNRPRAGLAQKIPATGRGEEEVRHEYRSRSRIRP